MGEEPDPGGTLVGRRRRVIIHERRDVELRFTTFTMVYHPRVEATWFVLKICYTPDSGRKYSKSQVLVTLVRKKNQRCKFVKYASHICLVIQSFPKM